MSTPSNADTFLMGGGTKSAFSKTDPVGATVTGTVVSTEIRQQTDMETGKPLEWENGDPRMQLVVVVQTDTRDDEDDDGRRAIYVKGSKSVGSKSVHDAVRAAVQAAGAKGLEPGGTLTMAYIGDEPSKTRGFNDRKLWAAQYKVPDAAAASGDFLGAVGGQPTAPTTPPVSAPAPAPVSAPAPTPAAAPAPAGDTPLAKAKALAALGMTAEQIAPQLGLDPTVVATLIAA